jgi:hypothetical protein
LGIFVEEPDDRRIGTGKRIGWISGRKPSLALVGPLKAPAGVNSKWKRSWIQKFNRSCDHALDGISAAWCDGTEIFAELASAAAPGYQVAAVENERFERAFKFFNLEPQRLYLSMKIHPAEEGELLADAVIRSRRALAGKGGEIQEKIHFSANVRLRRELSAQTRISPPNIPDHWQKVTASDIYRLFFHGPAFQVLESVYLNGDQAIGLAPDLPALTQPAGAANLMAPRLVELCLQTAGIWELKTKARMALPEAISSVAVWCDPKKAGEVQGRLMAMVKTTGDGGQFDAQVVDEQGLVYVELKGYKTVSLPVGVPLGK